MSKKTKNRLAAPTQEPKDFETKIEAPKEEFATSLTPVADAEEKKEEAPKSEPAASEEKKDSAPEMAEVTPDKD